MLSSRVFHPGQISPSRKTWAAVLLLALAVRTDLLEATPPVAGLLGSEILRRHNGIIDFGRRTLYLKR